MENLPKRVDDFYGYVIELTSWIEEEGKESPYSEELLECGGSICGVIRDAKSIDSVSKEDCARICDLADEFCRLMGLLVITGVLTEIQSKPLLSECMFIKSEVSRLKK